MCRRCLKLFFLSNFNLENLSTIKSINYIGLIPILTKAIQEQQEIIDAEKNKDKLQILFSLICILKCVGLNFLFLFHHHYYLKHSKFFKIK